MLMAAEQLLLGNVKEVFMHEKNVGGESGLTILPWNECENATNEEELEEKCGEILLGNGGMLICVCAICDCRFTDLSLFRDHLMKNRCEPDLQNSGYDNYETFSPELETISDHENIDMMTDEIDELDKADDFVDTDKSSATMGVYLEADSDLTSFHDVNYTQADEEETFEETTSHKEECVEYADLTKALHRQTNPQKLYSKDKKRKPRKKELTVEQMAFCAVCTRSYANGFRKHLRKKHSDILSTTEMDNDTIESLESKLAKSLNEMVCVYCNLVFNEFTKFKMHSSEHLGRNMYVCKLCPKKFSSQFNRRVHMNIHEGTRPYKCPQCPKDFNNPNNLQKHINLHLNIVRFKCSFCGKGCVTNSERKVHERWHTKEQPYQCEQCGKRFVTELLLKYHKLRHQEIKNFKCPYCEKAFYNSALLNSHLPTHTKERNFKCNVCSQTFPRRNALSQHKLLHQNVKKYTCETCGMKFAQFPGLYSHRKTHGKPLK